MHPVNIQAWFKAHLLCLDGQGRGPAGYLHGLSPGCVQVRCLHGHQKPMARGSWNQDPEAGVRSGCVEAGAGSGCATEQGPLEKAQPQKLLPDDLGVTQWRESSCPGQQVLTGSLLQVPRSLAPPAAHLGFPH